MTWHVAYVAPRSEWELAQEFKTAIGFDAYVPAERHWAVVRGVRMPVHRPLFSRYVLFNPGADVWQRAKIKGVIDVLRNGLIPSCVSDGYVQALQRFESVGEFDFTKKTPNEFNVGDKVRVMDGPLSGYDAIITEFAYKLRSAGPKKRAKVLVQFMNRMTQFEVDVAHLEKQSNEQPRI